MIPYLVINGKTSKGITGLMVQNLAPISKPKVRTNIEEIDGRDGDIVTTLGYSAYDKEVTIGLYGDYNVDDVISFFDTSGQVTFSNEPDKYYNFAIYEQIDFDKLIRFKTATVKFHVQPFKYSEDETTKSYSYAEGTTSASIKIRNNGNVYSKPKVTITGSGNIYIYLGNTQVLLLSLDSDQTIIIDVSTMNAYDESGNYLNRLVTGDYDDFILQAGVNTIDITGEVTEVKIDNYSRWI